MARKRKQAPADLSPAPKTQEPAGDPSLRIDLERKFGKVELGDGAYAAIDSALPAGDSFTIQFTPFERYKYALSGFDIWGLERSRRVTEAPELIDRNAAIRAIETLLKPGEIGLGDVSLFRVK